MSDRISADEYQSQPKERDIQKALFRWARLQRGKYPQLENLYANVNGQYRKGERPEPGLKKGVPDAFLAYPSGGHHGLYLELKREGTYTRPSQQEWLGRLTEAGYACAVVRSVGEAIKYVKAYLAGSLGDRPERLWPEKR